MTTIQMSEYGAALTGREFGKNSFNTAKAKAVFPIELDFKEVLSIGSSFADEFVAEFAKMQNSSIKVRNANRVVKDCLEDVAEEKQINIIYE